MKSGLGKLLGLDIFLVQNRKPKSQATNLRRMFVRVGAAGFFQNFGFQGFIFCLQILYLGFIGLFWLFFLATYVSSRRYKIWKFISAQNSRNSAKLENLISLRSLAISDCQNLKSLPEGIQQLSELQHLSIQACPELEKRCKRAEGEDWQKISHIPYVYIGTSILQNRQDTAASSSSSQVRLFLIASFHFSYKQIPVDQKFNQISIQDLVHSLFAFYGSPYLIFSRACMFLLFFFM